MFQFTKARAIGLLLLVMLFGPSSVTAAEKPGVTKGPSREPATAEEAARVLDLRIIPVMEGATVGHRTLGTLMYQAKGTSKAAFEFQRQLLKKLGFQELSGGYHDKASSSGDFTKDGFLVRISTYEAGDDPQKAGESSVTLVNEGNLALDKLPVPPGVKPFHPTSYEASYTTDAKPAETAAACRKLLLAAGWEPYGQGIVASPNQPDASMQYFKRNAIKLQSWVMTIPAEGGKTLIRYNAELLSADLPAPPDTADPRFDDSQKKLWFESPADQTDTIIAFYQQRLPKQGWQATTERPIVDDQMKTQFLIFRNSQKDMLSLNTSLYAGKVGVTLTHLSAAEVDEAERLANKQAEIAKQKLAERNKKVNVTVPLPAKAAKLKQTKEHLVEFSLATGSGPATLRQYREQLLKEDWIEKEGRELDKTSGALIFEKGYAKLTLSYFDLGVGDVDIKFEGTPNVVLETLQDKGKPPADAPKTSARDPKTPKTPNIPGVPDVGKLLKAVEDLSDELAAPKPAKPAPAANGPVKVAEISLPKDVESIEYSKSTKMIKLTARSDVKTLATFFIDELTEQGWSEPSSGLVSEGSAILKLVRSKAELTIFLTKKGDGSEATIMTKGLVWDEVPASKAAAASKTTTATKAAAASKKTVTEKPSRSAKPGKLAGTDTPKPNVTTPVEKETPATKVNGPQITLADQKQSHAMLWLGKKNFKLEYGVAYELKRPDRTETEVILSAKPIAVDKLVALLSREEDTGDAIGFGPQLKLTFDASGKLNYYYLHAEGANIGRGGEDLATSELKIKDGRARGKAVMEKPGEAFGDTYRFDATIDTKLANGQ